MSLKSLGKRSFSLGTYEANDRTDTVGRPLVFELTAEIDFDTIVQHMGLRAIKSARKQAGMGYGAVTVKAVIR